MRVLCGMRTTKGRELFLRQRSNFLLVKPLQPTERQRVRLAPQLLFSVMNHTAYGGLSEEVLL